MFDNIIVAVAADTGKSPLFSLEERVAMAEKVFAKEPNISVEPFQGLLVEYVARRNVHTVLRGLRAVSDFEYEFQIALMNRKLRPDIEVIGKPCPLFVPLVEAGYVDHSAPDKQEITKLVIAQYLTVIRDAGVDTLILGCTHYPLIKTMIGEFMGRNVVLVDPAKTAAHHLERILSERGLKADHPAGQAHFYVSDAPDGFVQTADLFLGEYKGGEVEQIAIDKY